MNIEVKFSENNQSFDVDMKEIKVIDPSDQLAKVAKTGDYNDLENKPKIVTDYNELTNKPIKSGKEPYSIENGEFVKTNAPGCAAFGRESVAGDPKDKVKSSFALAWGTYCEALRQRTAAFGWKCLCDENAENSMAGGNEVSVLAKNAFGWGNGCIIHPTATNSVVFGTKCEAYWADSLVGGNTCVSKQGYTIVWGEGLNAFDSNRAVFGRFNESTPSALFILGNGTDEDHRSNAFWVTENGIAGAKVQFTAPELNSPKIITGGTLSINAFGGIVDFNNNTLQNFKVNYPTKGTDATNRTYVDNKATSTLNSAKKYADGLAGDIDKALDSIIAIQNSYIGGETV